MKVIYRALAGSRAKSKKKNKPGKTHSPASIAQRYMEVRRLRERIEAEARAFVR